MEFSQIPNKLKPHYILLETDINFPNIQVQSLAKLNIFYIFKLYIQRCSSNGLLKSFQFIIR